MTARVVTVRSGEPVTAAVERMTRFGFSALPVVTASNRLVGIVSLLDVTVGRVMTSPAVSVPADATVAQARALLVEQGLRTPPVVDGAGRLVGVLGRSDLV